MSYHSQSNTTDTRSKIKRKPYSLTIVRVVSLTIQYHRYKTKRKPHSLTIVRVVLLTINNDKCNTYDKHGN